MQPALQVLVVPPPASVGSVGERTSACLVATVRSAANTGVAMTSMIAIVVAQLEARFIVNFTLTAPAELRIYKKVTFGLRGEKGGRALHLSNNTHCALSKLNTSKNKRVYILYIPVFQWHQ